MVVRPQARVQASDAAAVGVFDQRAEQPAPDAAAVSVVVQLVGHLGLTGTVDDVAGPTGRPGRVSATSPTRRSGSTSTSVATMAGVSSGTCLR